MNLDDNILDKITPNTQQDEITTKLLKKLGWKDVNYIPNGRSAKHKQLAVNLASAIVAWNKETERDDFIKNI